MKQRPKNCQVMIFYLDDDATKEKVLPQMLTAKDAIGWADRIRELQEQTLDLGYSTGVKVTGQAK